MSKIEIQKVSARGNLGKMTHSYNIFFEEEYTEQGYSLAQLVELRDFLTEYINNETRQNHEQE